MEIKRYEILSKQEKIIIKFYGFIQIKSKKLSFFVLVLF